MTALLRFRWIAVTVLVAALTGCPQMFVYVPEGAESILPSQNPETSTPGVAAKPVFLTSSVLGGDALPISAAVASYSSDQLITITTETVGATIYYTIDGTDPDPYDAEILTFSADNPIDQAAGAGTTVRIKAVALAPQMYPSEVADVEVTIDYLRVSAPSILPATEDQTADFEITLSTQDDDAQIWYVTSATGPIDAQVDPVPGQDTLYTGPIAVAGHDSQVWIEAIATKDQMDDSVVSGAQFDLQYPTAVAPVYSLADGSYATGTTVTLTSATPGAQIWYLSSTSGVPGSDPVPSAPSILYTGPITLGANPQLWIKAIAVKDQTLTSAVSAAAYGVFPASPTGLAVASPTVDSLTVSWNTSAGATGYELYRDTAAGGAFGDKVYDGSATSIVDDDGGVSLNSGTQYYYKVLAKGPGGSSPLSGAALGTTTDVDYFYIRSDDANGGAPWGSDVANNAAMDLAIGAGVWTATYFESGIAPSDVFRSTTRLVYIDGGDLGAVELAAYLGDNLATYIEPWVAAGGVLFLNAAPNEGAGMSFGFGDVTLVYGGASSTLSDAVVVTSAHPILSGPHPVGGTLPLGDAYTGSSFSHAMVTGSGLSPVITSATPAGTVLAERAWGSGYVLFGGMTTSNFHSPSPDGTNLRANMIEYLLAQSPGARRPLVGPPRPVEAAGAGDPGVDVRGHAGYP